MKSKQILGLIFTIIGAVALAVGTMAIFNKTLAFGQNAFGVTVVGLIFFLSGMGLMRSVGTSN